SILDPAAGISGDMTLGALLSLGVPATWLEELPARLGLAGVRVAVRGVRRSGVGCKQVEFAIPEQPHGRHVSEIVQLVERAPLTTAVKERAVRAFRLLGEAEGRVHGVPAERVHLHEVGAVDAVLDIVGAIEGFERLGVDAVYNWPVAVGTGWVEAAHGRLPVPAPATTILLEGVEVASGGPVEGEATTPTGAALVRVLSAGPPPARWRMIGAGWGAGRRGGGVPPQHHRGGAARERGAGDAGAPAGNGAAGPESRSPCEGARAAGGKRRRGAPQARIRRRSGGGRSPRPAAARGGAHGSARRRAPRGANQGVLTCESVGRWA